MKPGKAAFLEGSIFKHVAVMTLTGALGLMSLFLVELVDLYFLGLLNDQKITAAIGFAGTLNFANLSMSIGTGIAAVAMVARNVGAKQFDRAKDYSTNALVLAVLVSSIYTLSICIFITPILNLLGASGETAEMAKIFIWTTAPGFVFLAGALSCSFSLRGVGDAKRAMFITLSAAIITLILDPLFIFTFGWGIQGAAAANAIAYICSFGVGFYGLKIKHNFLPRFSLEKFKRDIPSLWGVAFPTLIAQLATPFAAAYLTYVFAPFGDAIVAGNTVVNRVIPVAFGVIFSLAGAVGPIIGQNYGAKNFDRVKRTLRDGLIFAILYACGTSLILFLLRNHIIAAFNITGAAAELVLFFCTYIALSWALMGGLFVATAAFNNLSKPLYSLLANWARATVGTIPFALIGAAYGGPQGIMVATAIGGAIFGLATMAWAFALTNKLAKTPPP